MSGVAPGARWPSILGDTLDVVAPVDHQGAQLGAGLCVYKPLCALRFYPELTVQQPPVSCIPAFPNCPAGHPDNRCLGHPPKSGTVDQDRVLLSEYTYNW